MMKQPFPSAPPRGSKVNAGRSSSRGEKVRHPEGASATEPGAPRSDATAEQTPMPRMSEQKGVRRFITTESCKLGQSIGSAVLVAQQFIGFGMIGETFALRVPVQNGASLERDVCQESGAGAAVTDFDIAVAFGPALDAVEEVARMWRGISRGNAADLSGLDPGQRFLAIL